MKLAKDNVVVKRLSAIEDLGSIEILCSDKTGTLTENRMKVIDQYNIGSNDLIFHGALAGSLMSGNEEFIGSFDEALMEALGDSGKPRISEYQKLGEIPFDPNRRRDSILIRKEGECLLVVRGAPENLLDLSLNVSGQEKENIMKWVEAEGKEGNRILAIGFKAVKNGSQCDLLKDEGGLTLAGLVSFSDPVKEGVMETIMQAEKLGVRIKILTGDSEDVARTIATQVGLVKNPDEVRLGLNLDLIKSEKEQIDFVDRTAVFARVNPEQKYKIIQLLQKRYEVGFLGEGINDAPALKLANVGIVVESASDISRDSADIVLLEKNLNVIIEGIKSGRATFENTIKYIKTTLISNFGNFYTIAIVSLFIPYLPMLPGQILLLNLLSDFPMIAISTDRVDEDQMRRPKSYKIGEILAISVILGIVSTIFDFIFFFAFNNPADPRLLQTNWFIGSVLTELALIFSLRTRLPMFQSKRPRGTLVWLSLIAGLFAIILPYTVFGQNTFGFLRPKPEYITLILGIVLAYLIATEIIKVFYYRKKLNLSFSNGFLSAKIEKIS
jgi:Mg2+-importing ATPase